MQNRYVGDIGDFGKYGMLRFIFGCSNLKLGVNWYLTPDEKGNNDGKFIDYLLNKNKKRFHGCDNDLYDQLRGIVLSSNRKISNIQRLKILHNAKFYTDQILPESKNGFNRSNWFKESCEYLKNCDVFFLDPDNGIETKSCTRKKLPKYVLIDEIEKYYKYGKSLIIYQHLDMKPNEERLKRYKEIKSLLFAERIFYLRYHRQSARDYIFILQQKHYDKIKKRVNEFLNCPWGAASKSPHFTYHDL